MDWSLRSVLGSLQLPLAGLGFVLLAAAAWVLYTLPSSQPGSDGFAEGLAAFFLLVLGAAGFVLLVGGLLIPPGPGFGIAFTQRQRWLFAYALVAPLVGVVALVVSIVTVSPVTGISSEWLLVFVVATETAPLAVLLGLGWKAAQVVRARV
jgi:hypothetical protein